MTDPRAAYAARFNARAIARPRPPAPPLTDEQIEALPTELQRNAAYAMRSLRAASESWAKVDFSAFRPVR
jgi:hypothetical protein